MTSAVIRDSALKDAQNQINAGTLRAAEVRREGIKTPPARKSVPYLGAQQDLQNAFCVGAFHGVDPLRKGIFFTDEAVDVDGVSFQKIERWSDASATWFDTARLIHARPRGVHRRRPGRGGLQY